MANRYKLRRRRPKQQERRTMYAAPGTKFDVDIAEYWARFAFERDYPGRRIVGIDSRHTDTGQTIITSVTWTER